MFWAIKKRCLRETVSKMLPSVSHNRVLDTLTAEKFTFRKMYSLPFIASW